MNKFTVALAAGVMALPVAAQAECGTVSITEPAFPRWMPVSSPAEA